MSVAEGVRDIRPSALIEPGRWMRDKLPIVFGPLVTVFRAFNRLEHVDQCWLILRLHPRLERLFLPYLSRISEPKLQKFSHVLLAGLILALKMRTLMS